MGIPKLNKWLTENCSPSSIRTCSLLDFQDKTVAVDISIYLYRFLSEENYYENLYLFFSLFRYYCIHPIFVFDGKAPIEKRATMQKRKQEKQADLFYHVFTEKNIKRIRIKIYCPLFRRNN